MNLVLSVMLVLAFVPALLAQDAPPEKAVPTTQPAEKAESGLYPRVKLQTTLGDIVIELNAEKAPITVDNFIGYVESGFYKGTIFHRVMPNFMLQAGGLTAEMEEKTAGLKPSIKNEWKNGLKNVKGTIAMARGGHPDSAKAQFFINVKDNQMLDMPRDGAAYAVFGKVVEGMDVVEKIRTAKCTVHPKYRTRDGAVTPAEPIVIKDTKLVGKYDREKVKAIVTAQHKEEAQAKIKARLEREKKLKERQGDLKARLEEQMQKMREYVKQVEAETGKKAEKTASGLMYVVLKEGDGPAPKPTDMVQVKYKGWLLSGEVFDSGEIGFSLKRGVIQGWLEGVAMMKVGGKRRLIIPPQLAYAEHGKGQAIPPNTVLVFDVELLEIK